MELLKNNLVYMQANKKPYTLSNIIAEGVGIKHSSITRTIRKHEKDFEEFGKLGFKIRPSDSGQNEKIYILNEEQATLLITYLKNTDIVREFKKRLVKEFYKLKEDIINFRIQREIEKPIRKNLTDAINEWEYKNKWSYKSITDLMFKSVTGLTAKQLRELRGTGNDIALNLLTSSELKEYQNTEFAVITLLGRGWTYENIKSEILRVN